MRCGNEFRLRAICHEMQVHCGGPRKLGAAEGYSRMWIEVFSEAGALDQPQAVTANARGEVGAPVALQSVDQHPVYDQPNRTSPIALWLEFWATGLEARHAIGDPGQPARQPLYQARVPLR